MKNLFVPKYFTFKELTRTSTGFSNHPTEFVHIQNLVLLGAVLDYVHYLLKDKCGKNVAIFVNSAFRTPNVNMSVRGAKNSFHLVGLASDIECFYMTELREVLQDMKENGWFVEFIDHDSYFHIAVNQIEAYSLLKDVLNSNIQ